MSTESASTQSGRPKSQRHKHQLAAEHRRQVHARSDVLRHRLAKAALEARRPLTQVERAHMRGHLGGFEVEEGGVEAGEGWGTAVCRGNFATFPMQ